MTLVVTLCEMCWLNLRYKTWASFFCETGEMIFSVMLWFKPAVMKKLADFGRPIQQVSRVIQF